VPHNEPPHKDIKIAQSIDKIKTGENMREEDGRRLDIETKSV
jgi:hypothetical protein